MSATARVDAHQRRGRTARAGRPVGAAAPLSDGRVARALGRGPRCSTRPSPRWPAPAHRWSTEFAPASLAAALGLTLDAGRAADRRRPRADLPPPPPLGPRRGRAGAGVAGPRDLPGDPRPRPSRRSRSPTGSSPRSPTRSAWSTPPGWSRRPGSTSTPTAPSPTRSTSWPGAGSGSDTAATPATTDVFMTLDTPDAQALRPDRQPHRRRARRASATPTTSTSAAPGRSGSSPTPSTPSTSSPAATARPTHGRDRCAGPLPPPHPRRPRTGDGTGAVSIEKLGAATTQLLTDWLARHCAVGGKINLRPVLDLDRATGPSTSTTHPRRCANTSSCATPTACSPAAAATPGPATSTTSPPTSRSTTADHPARPHPANLAPLCRTHHRMKTHTAWDYKPLDGRRLPLDRTHRPPVRGRPRLPTPTRPKNLTPHTPAPAPAGATGTSTHHRNQAPTASSCLTVSDRTR